jgi:low temperature requirement protein LtrA
MHSVETRPQWVVPMKPRDNTEAHRAATPLEIFFDLVFVVAIARAAVYLHHGIAEDHVVDAVINFVVVFFGIWWAWFHFTWFAAAYDNGDVPYRLVVFVQMTGALIVAAGVERLFMERDFTVSVLGYVVMRVAGITNYLRASYDDPIHRAATLRYAIGIGLVQIGWVILLFLPASLHLPGFVVFVLLELLVPVWGEMAVPTTWHAGHIRERYGLFTIIVLGETLLSTSVALQTVIDEGAIFGEMLTIIIGGLLIMYAMWWLYFYQPSDYLLKSLKDAFMWSYGHFFIFIAIAAAGAGIAVAIDHATHHAEITAFTAGMVVALPVAIYVLSLWVLHEHPRATNTFDRWIHPVMVVLILLTPLTGQAVLFTGILLFILIMIRLVRHLE